MTHDFPDQQLGKAIPYGVYDIAADSGWVSVGADHDTAAFAVATIRRWWQAVGADRYPHAEKLLITADAGGSNGYRTRLWKTELAALAAEAGFAITVCHFPPGTSKWNKIEHRLFSHISSNWRGQTLASHEVVVNLIAATTTRTGLTVHAELDHADYQGNQDQRQADSRTESPRHHPPRLARRMELHADRRAAGTVTSRPVNARVISSQLHSSSRVPVQRRRGLGREPVPRSDVPEAVSRGLVDVLMPVHPVARVGQLVDLGLVAHGVDPITATPFLQGLRVHADAVHAHEVGHCGTVGSVHRDVVPGHDVLRSRRCVPCHAADRVPVPAGGGEPARHLRAEGQQRRGDFLDDRDHVRVVGVEALGDRRALGSPFDRVAAHLALVGVDEAA